MRWWPRRGPNGDSFKRAEQEALLRAAERMTPVYERLAPHVAELPEDEFVARVRLAFARRSP